ncbi:hypothetical protein GCM10010285_46720 [Streptomyces pseudogriseolus]|uniref:Uncharacterized protein n=1 Tax=Streptomyces pseudogriseolus TaxID=36817 RepID=A0ABQ2TD59_STREZ|nr:hypothetical protein GCM10010285_46720 [Streptomyces rubiginosus]
MEHGELQERAWVGGAAGAVPPGEGATHEKQRRECAPLRVIRVRSCCAAGAGAYAVPVPPAPRVDDRATATEIDTSTAIAGAL